MTKFEQIGVNLQNDAMTKEEARKNFSYSCRVCCNRGMQIQCDKCAISVCHQETMACFDEINNHKKHGGDISEEV